MFKRLLFVGLLSMSLIALVSTEASAICRIYRGFLVGCGSVCPDTLLTGVGNPEINPVAVCVGLGVTKASVFCQNNGNNSETAQGTPFDLNVVIASSDFVRVEDLTNQRGGADVSWCWSDPELYAQLAPFIPPPESPDYPCQNRNWSVVQDVIFVKEAYVYYQAYVQDGKDPDPCMDLSDSKCRYCTLGPNDLCSYSCEDRPVTQCIQQFGGQQICNCLQPPPL